MSDSEGAETGTPKAIVVGHGDFSAGLVSAVGQICGLADKLVVLSNTGLAAVDIEAAIRHQLERTGARVIFTDLPGGSGTIAARRIAKENPDIVLVTGVNLATLLDFVFSSAGTPEEAARAAAERGKASLIVIERG